MYPVWKVSVDRCMSERASWRAERSHELSEQILSNAPINNTAIVIIVIVIIAIVIAIELQ